MDTYEIPAQAGTRTRKQAYYLKIAAQYEIQQDLARGKIGVKEAADLLNSISPSPSSLPAEYKTTVPATISKDNTNKETVLSGLLTTLASQQNQSSAGSDLGIISTPESPLPRRGQLQREDFGTPITEGYMSAPPSYKTKRHAGAALLSHKILKHTPTQPQSASDNIEYKLTAKNAASMERVERSQEEESTSALNDLCFGSPYPQSQLGIRISRTNRQATELNASVSDTNYTTPTCTMMTLDSVIFDPTQNKTESCLLGSPIPANGYTGIRIDPNCGYIETNAGTNSPARSLHLAAPIDELVEKVDVDSLRQKVRELERQVAELQEPEFSERQTLHRIFCSGGKPTVWLDHPRARNTRRKCQHYEANIPIPDERAYFKRNKHIHFVVYQDFQCCGDSMTGIKESGYESSVSSTSSDDDDDPRMAQHPFSIISREFAELISLLQVRANIRDWDRGFKLYEHIVGPHNCILRYIERIRATILTFNPRQQHLLNLLFDFIQDTFGDEFCQATKLFSHGYASADTICYLIGPEDVIVGKDNTHSLQAYIVRTWPQLDHNGKVTFKAWSWEFNGLFWKSEINIKLDLNNIFEDTYNVQINQLEYYPLKYGDSNTRDFLERRGFQFWSCRCRRFINYSGWNADNDDQFVNVRFMIDTMTYRKMHPLSPVAREAQVDGLGERMKDDLPLEGDQILILPSTIYGFHIQEKKWFNLKVEFIQDILWNKMAFESLVIDNGTKELVSALVENKIAAEAGTDMMSNKGNGLIILLHGAPGTGKTLTAVISAGIESVAEHAEKPLYRVTTGDVGTDPEAVEKYLTSVFYLGKVWGCVVLLDEADVFLEERTLSDLTRNALVSVFLRVLEYYDGILILTSNRVGTFDSAFKSRIQLALHYDNLTHQQRIKIWQGFIKRLEDVAYDDIDIDELSLDKNIKKLAKHNLNGRQIRNNITTARQLALYKKEQMNMSHLESVIEVSLKFENYLQKVKSGTDEDLARADAIR